jgi:hypothetical protein
LFTNNILMTRGLFMDAKAEAKAEAGESQGNAEAQVEAAQILSETKSILENDRFVYISGDHGSGWIDKDVIYPHPEQIFLAGLLWARLLWIALRDLTAPVPAG